MIEMMYMVLETLSVLVSSDRKLVSVMDEVLVSELAALSEEVS